MQISAQRLKDMLEESQPDHHMAFKDLFALGCMLHLQGEKQAGRKMVSEVMRAIDQVGTKTYRITLIEQLEGNERRFAREIEAHSEVNVLSVDPAVVPGI